MVACYGNVRSRIVVYAEVALERRDGELPTIAKLADVARVGELRGDGGIGYRCGKTEVEVLWMDISTVQQACVAEDAVDAVAVRIDASSIVWSEAGGQVEVFFRRLDT